MASSLFDRRVFAASGERMGALHASLPNATLDQLAQEVLRRVVVALPRSGPAWMAPDPSEIDALTQALLGESDEAAAEMMLSRHRDGLALDRLYIAYLAAAAIRLGQWWSTTRITTGEVIRGTGRIYAILQAIRHVRVNPVLRHTQSLVFASVPNESHVLGVRMAADLFRAKGWDVTLLTGLSHDALVRELDTLPCALLGLSASTPERLGDLARLVLALRISHPHLPIVVSGRIVRSDEDLVRLVDPEAIVADVPEGLRVIDQLVQDVARAVSG